MAKPRADRSDSDPERTPVAELIQTTLDSWYPRDLPTKFERPADGQAGRQVKSERVFTVGEVSRLVGMSPARIRSWEGRYRFLKPRRDPRNWRLYTYEDIEVLRQAKQTGPPSSQLRMRGSDA